ncbi:MAG: hypothetical protein ACREHD_13305 [Pirellulales bacterium]
MRNVWRRKAIGEAARSTACYAAAASACLLILSLLTQLWRLDLSVPFVYRDDSFLVQVWTKSIVDQGWYLNDPRLAAPFGAEMHDFPMADNLHFGLLKLLAYFDPRWAVVVNVYFLLTFPFVTLSSLFALRQLGIKGGPALVASLLYTFLPYHWIRGEGHLFLAAYYIVPLSILVAIWIYGSSTRGKLLLSLLVCALQASAGIYYAFFACFLFVVAGAAACCRARSLRPCRLVVALLAVTSLGVVANTAPSLAYALRHGGNHDVARRAVYESEIYGLKLAPLLLPVEFHDLPPLAKLRARYDRSSIHFNESASGTLGIIGGAAFVGLLGWSLFARAAARRHDLVDGLAMMNLALVLLGTVGGFGMLFSLLINPQIRAYNRVSVFIAFVSLAAGAVLLEWLQGRCSTPRSRTAFYAFLGLALVLGVLDQSPAALRPGLAWEALNRHQFETDAEFVKHVEAKLPEGAAVYELPYASFPESPAVHKMDAYEHFRPYLHARSLRFSHGAMRGRDADQWHRSLEELPVDEMLDKIADAGFAGIYIDRRGYADEAAQLEAELASRLGQSMVSRDARQSFFVLSSQENLTSSNRDRSRDRAGTAARPW